MRCPTKCRGADSTGTWLADGPRFAIAFPVCFPGVDEEKPDLLDRLTDRLLEHAEQDLVPDSLLDPENPSPYALLALGITIVAVAALGLLFLVG